MKIAKNKIDYDSLKIEVLVKTIQDTGLMDLIRINPENDDNLLMSITDYVSRKIDEVLLIAPSRIFDILAYQEETEVMAFMIESRFSGDYKNKMHECLSEVGSKIALEISNKQELLETN